jgi:hypothetical protein
LEEMPESDSIGGDGGQQLRKYVIADNNISEVFEHMNAFSSSCHSREVSSSLVEEAM